MRMQVFERGSTYSENSYWKDILKYFFLNIFIYWFEKERGVEEGGKEGKRGKERERERERERDVVPLTYAVISCFLYVP